MKQTRKIFLSLIVSMIIGIVIMPTMAAPGVELAQLEPTKVYLTADTNSDQDTFSYVIPTIPPLVVFHFKVTVYGYYNPGEHFLYKARHYSTAYMEATLGYYYRNLVVKHISSTYTHTFYDDPSTFGSYDGPMQWAKTTLDADLYFLFWYLGHLHLECMVTWG